MALDSESSTVAISENALAQGNTVAISPRGYTLELASDASIPTLQDPQWTVTRGTGKYNATTTGGYILSNNTIVYQTESVGADIMKGD